MQAEFAALMASLASTQADGLAPTSVHAMDIAEAHRTYLERWFYVCNHAMHRGLGEMYVNDPRFAANFARYAPDLAVYFRDAIAANADRYA